MLPKCIHITCNSAGSQQVRIYHNSGQDVETADQLKNAIESSGGVSGVRATLCDKLDIPKSVPVKWDDVGLINNIEYQ